MQQMEAARRDSEVQKFERPGEKPLGEVGAKALGGKIENQNSPCYGYRPPDRGERLRELISHGFSVSAFCRPAHRLHCESLRHRVCPRYLMLRTLGKCVKLFCRRRVGLMQLGERGGGRIDGGAEEGVSGRSEEHTSELQSLRHL